MKVAFLSQHFDVVLPPGQGSVGLWTYEVAHRLGEDCHTTIIARRPRRQPLPLEIDGARLDFLSCAPSGWWRMASHAWGRAFPNSKPLFVQNFYALDFFLQATRRIRRLAPDVVHLQNCPQYTPAVRRAVPDAAIILHMHCDWLAQLDPKAMALCVAAADLVVGCSKHVVAAAQARFAETGVRFAILPNGAPVEPLCRESDQRTPGKVIFVGRVSPEKGIHTLLQAWPKVMAAHPHANLEILGPPEETPREFLVDLSNDSDVLDLARFYSGGKAFRGSYDAALRELIPSQLAHTVTFMGHKPHNVVIERLANSVLLVNPSLSESFGMSLVEALATGTPVVATRAGGMPEIIEATRGGVLVEKNDPDALARKIIELLASPEASAELGRRGAQRVSELYAWPRIAERTRLLHSETLSKRRAHSDSTTNRIGRRSATRTGVSRDEIGRPSTSGQSSELL